MAGGPQQQNAQRRLDWETPFRARMNELRARLRSVECAVTRLSPLRWDQVVEVMMAIWAHALPTGEARAPTERIRLTSGLSRDQYYRALAAAKEIGIVLAVTSYTSEARRSDLLRVAHAAIDELVAESRRCRAGPASGATPATRCDQVRPGATRCDQVRPGATTLKEHARASLELPKNLITNKPAAYQTEKGENGWRRLEKDLFDLGVEQASQAIAAVRDNGCTIAHAEAIINHWRTVGSWGAAALCWRLQRAQPHLRADLCWPQPTRSGGIFQ